jgi:hypothetical protein
MLYVRLFNNTQEGLTTFWDNHEQADYFDGMGLLLFTWTDDNEYFDTDTNTWINPPENYTYNFTQGEITALRQVLTDGNAGFGLDPDCHYWNDGIEFQFCTKTVPEPATIFLISLGAIGFKLIRRKRI